MTLEELVYEEMIDTWIEDVAPEIGGFTQEQQEWLLWG